MENGVINGQKSILNVSKEEKTTPIIWSRFKNSIERNGGGTLPEKTLWLNSMSENQIGTDEQFSTDF